MQLLTSRRDEYKRAALIAKKSGDTKTAISYIKIAKQFDTVIAGLEAGQPVDLSAMPPPPSDLPSSTSQTVTEPTRAEAESQKSGESEVTPTALENDPVDEPQEYVVEMPTTVLEALEQRLAKYKSQEEAAKAEGNSSKARRMGRIVKQYTDAIKLCKAGKPIPVDELPTPPGFPPIPVPGGAKPPSSPLPAVRPQAPPPAAPEVPPTPASPTAPATTVPQSPQPSTSSPDKLNVRKMGGSHQEKQLLQLLEKQKQFKLAAVQAKFVLLPPLANNLKLAAIAKKLATKKSLNATIAHVMKPTEVNLIMPKFELDLIIGLRPTLVKLGINKLFSTYAELTDIAETKSDPLKVSNVLQKITISVNEAGTNTIDTPDLINKFGAPGEPVLFNVNHPFLFTIEDTTTSTTVFIGKVTNPNEVTVVSNPQEAATEKPSEETENIPDQKDMCKLPEQPRHGAYESVQCRSNNNVCGNSPGSLVPQFWLLEYKCKLNYYLNSTGVGYSLCERGSWQNPLDCIKYCPPLKSLNVRIQCTFWDNDVSCDRPMKPGTVAKPECMESFRPAYEPKYSQLECLESGKWSFPIFHCISDIKDAWCLLPQPLQNGKFRPGRRCASQIDVPACSLTPETPVPPQWPLFYDCDPGYRPNTTNTVSVCLSGHWKPQLPVCVTEVGY